MRWEQALENASLEPHCIATGIQQLQPTLQFENIAQQYTADSLQSETDLNGQEAEAAQLCSETAAGAALIVPVSPCCMLAAGSSGSLQSLAAVFGGVLAAAR